MRTIYTVEVLTVVCVSWVCSLPFITATADGPKHIDATLTRAKFEELCSDLFDRLDLSVCSLMFSSRPMLYFHYTFRY